MRKIFPWTALGLLCAFPPTGAAEPVTLSKAALQCLYNQTAGLLREPADPLVVVLTPECRPAVPASAPLAGERFPLFELPTPAEPVPDETVLIFTKQQLRCFQQQFAAIVQQAEDPLALEFSEDCPAP